MNLSPPDHAPPKPPGSFGYYLLRIQCPVSAVAAAAGAFAELTSLPDYPAIATTIAFSLLGFMATFLVYGLRCNQWAAYQRTLSKAERGEHPSHPAAQPFIKRLNRYADNVDEHGPCEESTMEFVVHKSIPQHPKPPRPPSWFRTILLRIRATLLRSR